MEAISSDGENLFFVADCNTHWRLYPKKQELKNPLIVQKTVTAGESDVLKRMKQHRAELAPHQLSRREGKLFCEAIEEIEFLMRDLAELKLILGT